MNQQTVGIQADAAKLISALDQPHVQAWLRTEKGQQWIAGLRLDIEMANPMYMDQVERAAEAYDQEMQEVAPRCAS